jgi:hypothetical protein
VIFDLPGHTYHGAATVKYYQSSTLQKNYGYMDLGIAERWVYEYEDTMTIHLDRIHKQIMQHALSRHTLSIVTLRAIAVQKFWRELLYQPGLANLSYPKPMNRPKPIQI